MGRKKLVAPVALLDERQSEEMQRTVEKKVRALLKKASNKYKGMSFEFPTQIRYNITTDLEGDYNYEKNWIRLNPVLYFKNPALYLETAVVYQVARLVSKQRTKGKCKPHGKEWDEDMQLFRGKQKPATHARIEPPKQPKLTKEEEVLEDMEFLLARARRLKFPNFSSREGFNDKLYVMYEHYLHQLDGEKVAV